MGPATSIESPKIAHAFLDWARDVADYLNVLGNEVFARLVTPSMRTRHHANSSPRVIVSGECFVARRPKVGDVRHVSLWRWMREPRPS